MVQFKDYSVLINDTYIIKNLNVVLKPGSIHAFMGPNGSGKSSFALGLAGHAVYTVQGSAFLNGTDLLTLPIHERAQKGVFLAFQYPLEIPGLSLYTYCKELYTLHHGPVDTQAFKEIFDELVEYLVLDPLLLNRSLNEGFSGGQKKRIELLQLLLCKPQLLILDEIDSGLDVDSLGIVQRAIQRARQKNPSLIIIVITHYQRVLRYIKPDYVHIIMNNTLHQSGPATLAEQIDAQGYGIYE